MLLCPVSYDEDELHQQPRGGNGPPVSKRRQFIHCQWAPAGTEGDAEPGVIGTVGLSDDRGFFQLLRLGTNDSSFFRVGTDAQDFHEKPPGGEGGGQAAAPARGSEQLWDARPWSQFAFVPGGRGAVVFLQWQSNMVLWTRVSKRRAQPVARLGTHAQRVRVVVVDDAGSYAASGSDDGAVKLWALDTLSAVGAHDAAHAGAVTALHFRDAGKHLFSAGSDQRVCWWDVSSGAVLAEFRTHAAPLLELASSRVPPGAEARQQQAVGQLYGGHADGTLAVWSLETKELLRSVQSYSGSTAAVLSVAVAPGGDLVALGQLDGTLGAHKAGGTQQGPTAAGEMIGQCKLSSAVVCVGFQPPHQRGVEGDDVNKQLLCVCCREGVQFWSTAHLLSRVTHPAQQAANAQYEKLEAQHPIGVGAGMPPTPTRSPGPMTSDTRTAAADAAAAANDTVTDNTAADTNVDLDLETPRPQPTSPPPMTLPSTDMNVPSASALDGPPGGSSIRPLRISSSNHPRQNQNRRRRSSNIDAAADATASAASTQEEDEAQLEDMQHQQQLPPHSAAATPVASPERAEADAAAAGSAALAARRALAKAISGGERTAAAPSCSSAVAFASPADANFGNPLAFASTLVANRNREAAQQQQEQEEQEEGQGAGVGSHAMPKMNSTLRLAARLEEIQQERPAAAAVAKVIAAAKPSRGLVNFSMEDRKYGALTTIEILPEETGPTADLPPVTTVQYPPTHLLSLCTPPPASWTASALLPYSRRLYTYLVRDLTRVLRLVVCVYVAHGVSSGLWVALTLDDESNRYRMV